MGKFLERHKLLKAFQKKYIRHKYIYLLKKLRFQLKPSPERKFEPHMNPMINSTKHLKISKTNSTQTFPEN